MELNDKTFDDPYFGYPEEEMREAEKLAHELEREGEDLWGEFIAALRRGKEEVRRAHENQAIRKALLRTLDKLDTEPQRMVHQVWRNPQPVLRRSFNMVGRVAMVILAVIGALTVLVGSVEAFRIPVINFLVAHHDEFSTLTLPDSGIAAASDPTTPNTTDIDQVFDPLAGLLPEGYTLKVSSIISPTAQIAIYSNGSSDCLSYHVLEADGAFEVDTENADSYAKFQLNGHTAFFVEKGGYHIVWVDTVSGLSHKLYALGLDCDQFMAIANALSSTSQN